jgi:hypothetical protein
MDVYYLERSQQIFEELQRAQQLNAEGNTKECLNLLTSLYENKRIMIQAADAQPPV